MSKFELLLKNFYNPFWWKDMAIPYIQKNLTKKYSEFRYSESAPVCELMSEDWDNLIILDACRYDQFESLNSFSSDLESRNSLGSATPEFLRENFAGKTYHDTVYVTANPMYRTQGLNDVFHDVVDVWELEWDSERRTVLPETMKERTLETYRDYPNKRLIAHFMQPHYPFIGEAADVIGDHAGYEFAYRQVQGQDAIRDDPTVWSLLEDGKVNEESVWKAYNENLNIVLGHVENLVEDFSEKTVVTSDHGNLVGERVLPFGSRQYGHPVGVYTDALRKVPWVEIEGNRRKEVKSEPPEDHITDDHTTEADSTVTDRLADLGYVDQ
ncbi:hypothetical protein HALLA_13360 [Halostagnicola larsenii XH-48]|uniref:Sulfatase N-terminal domain-containing protein n=1 Tax=Halostagnicola larsenii XH-48 TaxID=797299 RepID=W0JM01_9EURY|nr:hypothetical protein [Halostagnicola larsenii]AHF99628.1 hypothetical protein HALLA_13360 [Halostagnicola larsenii XH-48]